MNYGASECAMYFNAKDIHLQDLNFVESIERRCGNELQWLRQESGTRLTLGGRKIWAYLNIGAFFVFIEVFCTDYKCEIYFRQSKNIKCCWCSHCIRCLVNLKHGEQHSLRNPVSFRLERYLGVERYQCASATLSNVYLYLCIYIGIFVYGKG